MKLHFVRSYKNIHALKYDIDEEFLETSLNPVILVFLLLDVENIKFTSKKIFVNLNKSKSTQ